MRVFTSVFVLDGLRATFEDIEKASDPNHRYFDGNEAKDTIRQQIAHLQAQIEIPCDRTGEGSA